MLGFDDSSDSIGENICIWYLFITNGLLCEVFIADVNLSSFILLCISWIFISFCLLYSLFYLTFAIVCSLIYLTSIINSSIYLFFGNLRFIISSGSSYKKGGSLICLNLYLFLFSFMWSVIRVKALTRLTNLQIQFALEMVFILLQLRCLLLIDNIFRLDFSLSTVQFFPLYLMLIDLKHVLGPCLFDLLFVYAPF